MTEPRFDFKKLRAGIFLQYGIELDETSLTILAILTQEMKRQFIKMDKAQEEMTMQIQHSKKALQVDHNHPRWQAFWHGMGQWGFGLCLAIITALTIFAIDLNKITEEKEAVYQELSWYKAHYDAAQKAGTKSASNGSKKNSKSKNK